MLFIAEKYSIKGMEKEDEKVKKGGTKEDISFETQNHDDEVWNDESIFTSTKLIRCLI
ncbi:hypothetical protein AMI01nite_27160 [Aneurinibacillus migulanus]|nr:hypothetical protein AMI01nite_27160 [Aneurinibacillus migulanus]